VNDGDIGRRVAEWSEELAAVETALSGASAHTADNADATRAVASLAGRALEAGGHLLRRAARSGIASPSIERVLRALPSRGVEAWVESVDLAAVEARLRRATDEAVEAGLPETPGEAETWAAWARQGLETRDAFESQLVALRFREGLGFEVERPVRERLAAALGTKDRALWPMSRRLVALNGWRRQMRDALDPEHRAGAWWFTARAECDDLLAVLAGEKPATKHVEGCDECQRDLARARLVDLPRTRHLSEDDLWNFDLGLLPPAERAYAERHARTCVACAQALAALAEGEQEIAAPTRTAGAGARTVDLPRAGRGGDEPEVLADDADFRLLLFRRGGRVTVVVQPRRPGLVAAAALELSGRTVHAKPGVDGLEIDLGSGPRERVTVRVRLGGEGGEVARTVDLARRR
jgi:hypothetical protein